MLFHSLTIATRVLHRRTRTLRVASEILPRNSNLHTAPGKLHPQLKIGIPQASLKYRSRGGHAGTTSHGPVDGLGSEEPIGEICDSRSKQESKIDI